MKKNMIVFLLLISPVILFSQNNKKSGKMENEKIKKSDKEWKEILTPTQYKILREKGTERAFTGQFYDFKEKGTYSCAACGNDLFNSDSKFDSMCGWPSYFEPISENAIEYHKDFSYGMSRIEVTCGKCGGHLGHVFDDGPPPTGKRYCINSGALKFKPFKN
jgi:peptide-methionine (R)-S-oxide reductase